MDCGRSTAAAGGQGSGELDGGASCMPIPPVPTISNKTAFLKEKLVLAKRKAASEFSSAVEPGLRPREDSHRSQCLPCSTLEVQSVSHPVDSSGSSPPALVPCFRDPEAFKYSSLAVHVDVKSGLHRYAQNREGPNLIVPLSRFSGGELWFQTSEGVETSESDPSMTGRLIPIADGPAFLMDPSVPHETRDWTETRVVLIAYSVLGSERLASDMSKVIEPLGFSTAPQGLGPFPVSLDPRPPPPLGHPPAEVSREVPKSVSDMFFVEIIILGQRK